MPDDKEFTPITTQEAFNAAIAEHLKRERETAVKPYADYDAIKDERDRLKSEVGTLRSEKTTLTGQLNEAQATIKRHETDSVKTRIAHEKGLPYEMAARLTGESESEIAADADRLAKVIGTIREPAPPLADTEMKNPGGLQSALQDLANNLNI